MDNKPNNVVYFPNQQVYRLKIELLEGPIESLGEWIREVEWLENANLAHLQEWVQSEIGFAENHLYDFFFGDGFGRRKEGLVLNPEGIGRFTTVDPEDYSVVTLKDVFSIKKKTRHFIHLFDWGDCWTFLIRKCGRANKIEEGKRYPHIIEKIGKNPKQWRAPITGGQSSGILQITLIDFEIWIPSAKYIV